MVTAMITGAAGMMGSHLAESLVNSGTPVLATFLAPTIDVSTVDKRVTFIPLDVCDREAVFSFIGAQRPTVIYHLAAQSLPTVSWQDPWTTVRVNVEGTVNMLEGILRARASDPDYDPVVVIACSSAEYGASLTPDRVPITEDAPLLPLHPYGVSKVAQDLLGFQYFANFGLKTIRARIFNCTGPRKRNDVISDLGRAFVRAERNNSDVRHGNLTTARGFVDVRDMVKALELLSVSGVYGDVYNICAEKSYVISEIVEFFFDEMGQRFPLTLDPKLIRPTDEAIIFGDIGKLRRDTGWSAAIDVRTTISDVVAYEREIYDRDPGGLS